MLSPFARVQMLAEMKKTSQEEAVERLDSSTKKILFENRRCARAKASRGRRDGVGGRVGAGKAADGRGAVAWTCDMWGGHAVERRVRAMG